MDHHVKAHYLRNRGYSNKKTCVLLLVKYPEEGNVKSRLAKHICEKIVVEIYRNFVLDILSMLNKSNIPFTVLFHPINALKKFEVWLGTKYEYVPQIGQNLGERIKNGFLNVFTKDFSNAIVLASDIPNLTENILLESYVAFDNSDAVIGPSPDGGYYLIGFKRDSFFPEIFEKMVWSRNTVFNETIERLKKAKCKVHILPLLPDIDTLEDLKVFVKKRNTATYDSSKTMKYLPQHKEILNERGHSSGISNCLTNKKYR